MSFPSAQFKKFSALAAEAANAKKGIDIRLLDLRRVQSGLSDYLLMCSANSLPHMKAIRDSIEESLEQVGLRTLHQEGSKGSRWIALDYGGLLVHIFHQDARAFYSLERLWPEASLVLWKGPAKKIKRKAFRKRSRS